MFWESSAFYKEITEILKSSKISGLLSNISFSLSTVPLKFPSKIPVGREHKALERWIEDRGATERERAKLGKVQQRPRGPRLERRLSVCARVCVRERTERARDSLPTSSSSSLTPTNNKNSLTLQRFFLFLSLQKKGFKVSVALDFEIRPPERKRNQQVLGCYEVFFFFVLRE